MRQDRSLRQRLGHAGEPPRPGFGESVYCPGGYGQEELERAGAYRVYEDPQDMLRHLDEVGVRLAD